MINYSAEVIIFKLISYFELKNMTELAEKLGVSQSVMSNWKARNAVGAICEKILEVEPAAFKIFDDKIQINKLDNTSVTGSGAAAIDNSAQKTISSSLPSNSSLPQYITDELNLLFSRAGKKNKTDDVIAAFDDFIYEQKKLLR